MSKCGFDPSQRHKVYSLPFGVTKEVKLSVFQFKVIHNILSTNSLLYKMKKVNSPNCPFCPNTEQIFLTYLYAASLAASFRKEFTEWYCALCNKHNMTNLSECEIVYGILKGSSSLQNLNHLILIGKYFLFICAKNNKKHQFADFVVSVRKKIDLKKYIAMRENKLNPFNMKWRDFKKWQHVQKFLISVCNDYFDSTFQQMTAVVVSFIHCDLLKFSCTLRDSLCGSKKYPYPPRRVFSSLTPHPPGFSVPRGFIVLPPTPWNFHDFSIWSPLTLGNSISTNNKTLHIYFDLVSNVIKFSCSCL